ncbi:MAG: OmpA family protein [Polaromonas sp.]|nr:OmpA family protein [Polaromonas sp.]
MSFPTRAIVWLVTAASAVVLPACQTTPAPAPAPTAPVAYTGPVLPIEQSERGVQIFLPSSVLFEVGKSSLDNAAADPYLDRVAHLLTTKTDKTVVLEGHADSTGTEAINTALSLQRAQTVSKALAERGVAVQRLSAAGFSSRRPVASNATEAGRRLNRRVEVVVLDETVENITRGEPANAFASAWAQLKTLIEQGQVQPVGKQ